MVELTIGIGYCFGIDLPVKMMLSLGGRIMELGNKIATLRKKAGLTQKELADTLMISAQSISKWENQQASPDITLLPKIAETFGVSIDELFDLTIEQKLNRLENRLDFEEDFPVEVFKENEQLLESLLDDKNYKYRAKSLLAMLYTHRMFSDQKKRARYAKEAIRLNPGKKECQWMLSKFAGHAYWDWNVGNHNHAIEFYKEIVNANKDVALPYYYLIDNLLADNRADEAERYLKELDRLSKDKLMVDIYGVYIEMIRHGDDAANKRIEELKTKYQNDSNFLFEMAQYYAKKGIFDKTIECYEISFDTDPRRPRFIDALQAISDIYEIQGDYQKAADTYDRIINCQREEWGQTDEAEIRDSIRKKKQLLSKVN